MKNVSTPERSSDYSANWPHTKRSSMQKEQWWSNKAEGADRLRDVLADGIRRRQDKTVKDDG